MFSPANKSTQKKNSTLNAMLKVLFFCLFVFLLLTSPPVFPCIDGCHIPISRLCKFCIDIHQICTIAIVLEFAPKSRNPLIFQAFVRFRGCFSKFREHLPLTRFSIMLFRPCSGSEPLEITRFNAPRLFR